VKSVLGIQAVTPEPGMISSVAPIRYNPPTSCLSRAREEVAIVDVKTVNVGLLPRSFANCANVNLAETAISLNVRDLVRR